MQLSIILPTLNEHNNLQVILPRLERILKKIKDYEVIIVDDNSSDGSWQFVQSYSRKNKRFKLIRRLHKKGLSSAINDGIKSAKGEYVAVMDADLQHDEKILPLMIRSLNGNDLVVASRWVKNGGCEGIKSHALIKGIVAKFISKLVLGVKLTDPMSGYFALKKSEFKKIEEKLNPTGYKFLLEFYIKSNPTRIVEIGYIFKNRKSGKSKQNLRVIIEYLKLTFQLWVYKVKNFQKNAKALN